MKIDQATASTVSDLWKRLQPRVEESERLEDAAQALATALHTQFDESVVIARVFVTVPFGDLPEDNKTFVKGLAEGAGSGTDLKPGTPVLSLVGTHGQESDWNDRRRSKGHVGIPLISSAFVGAIPMISRLLKELGVPIDWIDSPRSLSGIAPSKQESTTYEPSLVCKLLILGCRLLIPDRLLVRKQSSRPLGVQPVCSLWTMPERRKIKKVEVSSRPRTLLKIMESRACLVREARTQMDR